MTPNELLPQVYDELRKLAAAKLIAEKPGQTLNATALVHEAFLKLGGDRSFASKGDYLQAAAQAMRRILIDRARARNALKRGGGKRLELEAHHLAMEASCEDLQALEEAISKLSVNHPRLAQLANLRCFGGLKLDDCAESLGISPRTADSWWAYTRAWLAVELKDC